MQKRRNRQGGEKGGRKSRDKKFGSRQKSKRVLEEVTGRVQMTRDGYVFVIIEGEPDNDVFVKASKTRGALNGDTVRCAVTSERKEASSDAAKGGRKDAARRREGEIIEIVERSHKPFVGVLHIVGRQAWVLMQSRNMPYDISIDFDTLPEGAKRGMKVAALIDGWDKGEPTPKGHIVDVLGMPGENDTEMHAILAEYALPYRFEPEVENAADQISDQITEKDLKGRRDFRNTLTFTIDPTDAKDFDDALSFKKLDNGNYEIGVHIADVSYYVLPGTIVDKEAQERGTSVYLVDRTVPMLPEKLCNKLCSLRPHEEKLTFSVVVEMTPRGKIENRWFGRTAICSDYRFDYDGAQQIIESDGKEPADPAIGQDVREAIVTLNKLALTLRKRRFASGAISFERPEMKVEVDATGKPIRVYEKITKEANWLIEEFMLLANRSVAEFIATCGKMDGVAKKKAKTFVYRIHDEPNGEKIQGLREFAGNFGYKMDGGAEGRGLAKALNALLSDAKDKPEFNAIEMLALRSMAKACYSTDNIGHYGLAFKFYTHFTSPIRRYPDTMVHRLLAMYLDGADSQSKDYYEEQCQYASAREVVAAEAERSSIKYKLVEFMQDKVGGEFEGNISGLTEWGMYVEIDPTKIEGMVALRDIKSDFFEFDQEKYRIVGRRTGVIYNLGDRVKIRVKSADIEQKLLDYELVETGFEERAEKGPADDSAPSKGNKAARKAKVKAAIRLSKQRAERKKK
ncbi:MAG: ribonuclease R [Bacteroidales bacterium]|nr:ribonuclease R [Bacteroidales bacterium]MDY5442038.1 ribonuclease R [Candidatus Cryptobacteroides sp.]